MSKIGNKVIEAKLRTVLEGQEDMDLSKFDDNSALALIFAFYDDQQDFSEIIIDKHLHEIQELKLVELDLRTEVEFYKKRESSRMDEEWQGQGEASSRIIEQSRQLEEKYQKLRRVCEQQEDMIVEHEEDQDLLQKKILEGSEQHNEDQKQCADLRTQIEAQANREKETALKIQQLLEEREALVQDYEAQITQYKGQFIQELTQKLNEKHSEELQQSKRVAEGLQQEIRQQERLLKTAVEEVSQVFKLAQPADLKEGLGKWVQELKARVEEYRRSVKTAVGEDIKEVKDPLKQLAQYEKKQVQSRNLLIKKYLQV